MYTHFLITITIVIASYHVTSKIKLEYESYSVLEKIEKEFGIISLGIKGYRRSLKQTSIPVDNENFITQSMVLNLIDYQFDKIFQILNYHKQQLKKMVTKKSASPVTPTQEAPPEWKHLTLLSKSISIIEDVDAVDIKYRSDTDDDNVGFDDIKYGINYNIKSIQANPKATQIITTPPAQALKVPAQAVAAKPVEINQLLTQYIDNQLKTHEIKDKKGFERFLKTMWDIRQIMTISASHIFDTASDITLAIEWYTLYQRQLNDETYLSEYNLNMTAMFWCCISAIIYYRINSFYEVYYFTGSLKEGILQFLFDFYLIKLIYGNVMKMKRYKALDLIKKMRGVEGIHESSFQAILAMVFLLKTNFSAYTLDGFSNIIPILSLIFSIWSLISRFVFLDKSFVKESAQTVGFTLLDVLNCTWYNKINLWYVFHLYFRAFDVLCGIFVYSLIWVVFGGKWFAWFICMLCMHQMVKRICTDECDCYEIKSNLIAWISMSGFVTELLTLDLLVDYCFERLDKVMFFGWFSSCKLLQVLLFVLLECHVVWTRLLIISYLLVTIWYRDFDHSINTSTETAIFGTTCLFVISLIMHFICIKFYGMRKFLHLRGALNIFDIIARNDIESIHFCKQLNVDIFSKQKYKQRLPNLHHPKNVLDAIIMSNNFENYFVIEEWYNNVKNNCDTNLPNFDNYLKYLPHDVMQIILLLDFCTQIDLYIFLNEKIGLNVTQLFEGHWYSLYEFLWDILASSYLDSDDNYHQRLPDHVLIYFLSNFGIDINMVDDCGFTFLHRLMLEGARSLQTETTAEYNTKMTQMFKVLLTSGIDTKIKSKGGQTPQDLATNDDLYRLFGAQANLIANV